MWQGFRYSVVLRRNLQLIPSSHTQKADHVLEVAQNFKTFSLKLQIEATCIWGDNWHFAGRRRDSSWSSKAGSIDAFDVRLFAAPANLPIHGQPSVAD